MKSPDPFTALAAVVALLAPRAAADCLVGDIMYQEGDSIGHIGYECINSTHYDGMASTCGPDGEIVETEEQFVCGESTPYCVQCGPRGIGAALCLSTETTDRDCPPDEDPPVACTLEFAPVCGDDGVVYANACNAEAAGAEVAYAIVGEPDGDECDPADAPDVVCTTDWAPVCGADGVIYSNACNAGAADTEVAYAMSGDVAPGEECDPAAVPPIPCTLEFAPVCGDDGVVYSNSCNAEAAGAEVAYAIVGEPDGDECDPDEAPEPEPVACITLWAPVCGDDGAVYGNTCEAEAAGAEVAYNMDGAPYFGDVAPGEECDPDATPEPPVACTLDFSPVCADDGVIYSNACNAEAAGAEVAYEMDGDVNAGDECDPAAAPMPPIFTCTLEFVPVCASDGVIYSNACSAEAAGAEVAYETGGDVTAGEECDPAAAPVACITLWAPVCASDGVIYSNACNAEAAGAEVAYETGGDVNAGEECDPDAPPTPCSREFAPVCGDDAVIYSNACNAEAAGAEVAYNMDGDVTAGEECDPAAAPIACAAIWAPVCGLDSVIYSNACDAEASGTGAAYNIMDGDVNAGDECDPNAAPVQEPFVVDATDPTASPNVSPTPAPVSSAASCVISLAVLMMAGIATLLV